ncbi:MAG TPA: DUF1501 domain-containing protein [Verrucomicrobiae bacterium]|nr:DUF1501 domain-containing protein [Verrucomicrobiae bacterium]
MNPHFLTPRSRREMLKMCGCGFGYLGLTGLFASIAQAAAADANPLAPHAPHFPARAKRVIFLFMHGGPSQVDTFDPKPLLKRDNGKAAPNAPAEEAPAGAPPRAVGKLLASPWEFAPHGQSGLEISALFPEVAGCADDLCVIRSMNTTGLDHGQAVLSLHTGNATLVRPSMGSWVVYGLGTENQSLPGFITICPTMAHGGPQNYGTAFLPAVYQGTAIGRAGEPVSRAQIQNIRNAQAPAELQRRELDFLQAMNREKLRQAQADQQLEGVIESYELAFKMQTEAPQLTDIKDESAATLALYGIDGGPTDDFGRQCLLARRFAERGVRVIQVSHSFKWDQHQNLKKDHERNALEVDKPIAGLLKDLKQRGLLKDTLVVWGGEFGRTATVQQGADGRDHNPGGFSMWLAGGGVKGGMAYGATDDYGQFAVENKVHMHDLHATVLHLLGMDHKRLTYRYAGRDYRLTDVFGNVVNAIVA